MRTKNPYMWQNAAALTKTIRCHSTQIPSSAETDNAFCHEPVRSAQTLRTLRETRPRQPARAKTVHAQENDSAFRQLPCPPAGNPPHYAELACQKAHLSND